jgi:aldehyde dehydrogenase (NAD(P)+)
LLTNNRNEEEICAVHAADTNDVDLDTAVRGELLYKLAGLVEQHADILATIDAWDNGIRFSIPRVISPHLT